jgi:hypothetical protein
VAKSTVATKVHEAFDIHGDFGPQFALDLMLVVDHPPDIVDLTVGEVIRFGARIDFELFKNTRRGGPPDTVNVGQTDVYALTSG